MMEESLMSKQAWSSLFRREVEIIIPGTQEPRSVDERVPSSHGKPREEASRGNSLEMLLEVLLIRLEEM